MFEMRRKDKQKSAQWALDIMKNAEYATIGTVMEGNTPYVFTVSHAVINNYAYFHCAKAGLKVATLEKNPRVCMTCVGKTRVVPEKFSTAYMSAVAFGKAALVSDKDEIFQGFKAICEKYSPKEDWEAYFSRSDGHVCLYRIELSDITGKENVE